MVTGAAAGGLGAQAADALARAGATVAAVDLAIRQSDIATTVDLLRRRTVKSYGATCDVRDQVSVEAVFDDVEAKLGQVDILVHAAGVMLRKPALETSLAEWRDIIEINLIGTWIANVAAARRMVPRRSGKIINFASVYSNIVGFIPESAYYASKGGIVQLTRALAMEFGRQGINVNAVAPGTFFPTGMTEPLRDNRASLERMENRTMLGRLGEPSRDLAGSVVFLASAASDYVTGQILHLDGGWTAW